VPLDTVGQADATHQGKLMKTLLKQGVAFVALLCSLALAIPAVAQTAPPPSLQDEQLVAPIALYPDALVAQILAASTYPDQVVEAWRWTQQYPGLQGQELADRIEIESWDPSVKALIQFPSVLDSMNANLSWTSALGDAYANAPQAVLDAVQVMRQRAQSAGTLISTNQQTVTTQDQTITIEPAVPDVVYVPAYDPWVVYGDPLGIYPGWVGVPGIFWEGPDLYFGLGLGVAVLGGYAWGWHHWGFDWHRHEVMHDQAPYHSHGVAFAHRNDPGRAPFDHRSPEPGRAPDMRAGGAERTPTIRRPAEPAAHGLGPTGAFSGIDHGGVVRGYSDRGRASLGAGFRDGALAGGGFRGGAGFAGAPRSGGFAGGFGHGGGSVAHGGGFAGGSVAHGGGFAGGASHGGGGHR
jgi:hypothetical protein